MSHLHNIYYQKSTHSNEIGWYSKAVCPLHKTCLVPVHVPFNAMQEAGVFFCGLNFVEFC